MGKGGGHAPALPADKLNSAMTEQNETKARIAAPRESLPILESGARFFRIDVIFPVSPKGVLAKMTRATINCLNIR
jgi:hypothetical protein